jgi:uncharacterized RDD family membrane protein YckC
MKPAGGVRRIFAVVIDFSVFYALWFAVGLFIAAGSIYYALAAFFLIDVVLTAFFGVTAGRALTGIRVARIDGGQPGLGSAVIRTALVFTTGWAGLMWVTLSLWWSREEGSDQPMPERLWWDAAGRTAVVQRV